MVQDIDTRLSMPGLSPGKRQALIKDKTLKIGKVESLAKRIEDLANGNILTITFENKDSGERYRIVYTNISQDDAVAHLKLMANLQDGNNHLRGKGSTDQKLLNQTINMQR